MATKKMKKYKTQIAFDHGKLVVLARMAETLSGLSGAICPEAQAHFDQAYFGCNRAINKFLEEEEAERKAAIRKAKKGRK